MSSDAARYRRRDTSLAWRELERELLADDPTCALCDWPAEEAHRVGGCFAPAEENSEDNVIQPLCARCHENLCTRDPGVKNATYRMIEALE